MPETAFFVFFLFSVDSLYRDVVFLFSSSFSVDSLYRDAPEFEFGMRQTQEAPQNSSFPFGFPFNQGERAPVKIRRLSLTPT